MPNPPAAVAVHHGADSKLKLCGLMQMQTFISWLNLLKCGDDGDAKTKSDESLGFLMGGDATDERREASPSAEPPATKT